MLLLSILLLPAVLGADSVWNFGKYVVTIDETNTLTRIERTSDESLLEVNLSNIGFENIDKNAFNNVTNINSLNLANNWLTKLPNNIFSNFTSLQRLSLADNNLSTLDRVFIGLDELQTLDLSNNHFEHIGESYFYGLGRYVDITTKGNNISNISTYLFGEPKIAREKMVDEEKSEIKTKLTNLETGNFTSVQACMNTMNKDKLYYVDNLREGETMTPNCAEIRVDNTDLKLPLRGRRIYEFERGWYRVKNLPVRSLDLAKLRLTELAPHILNDLPENIVEIDLSNNTIVSYEAGIIKNWYIRSLILENNKIAKIGDDFLAKTNLSFLNLNHNVLYNTDFAKTLPSSLEEICLTYNKITDISPDSFSRLTKLVKLDISHNWLTTIPPGVFRYSGALRELNLYSNLLDIYKGIFTGLRNIEYLNIGSNGLKYVTKNTLFAMPDTLATVILDDNFIQSLEVGSFVRVPKFKLSLAGNNITRIVKGSFDLPSLEELNLGNNRMQLFDSNSFKGLANVKRLSLANNELTKLDRGVLKYLSLEILDLSMNPIKEFTRGTLNGMITSRNGSVFLAGVPLEHIHGTIFEDTF